MNILFLSLFSVAASQQCYKECMPWDTFCKSPEQIVASKCRLGVPVKWDQCEKLGISKRYLIRGGGSLVESMPCSDYQNNGGKQWQ